MHYRSYDNGGNYIWFGILLFFVFGGFKTLFLLLPLLSFVPLILVGYFAIKLLGRIFGNNRLRHTVEGRSESRLHYVELTVHLLVHAIKADGHVDQREIQSICRFFQQRLGFDSQQIYWVTDLIRHALRRQYNVIEITHEFNNQFGDDEKQLCAELLFEVIAADGTITNSEKKCVETIVEQLRVDKTFYEQLKRKYYSQVSDRDHEILGVSDKASPEEIKKAYKALCKKFHPDKVQHLGDEFKEFAEKKIKEINKAYDNLSRKAA